MMSSVRIIGGLVLVAAVLVQVSAQERAGGGLIKTPVTETCLRCICQAVSGCKLKQCEGDHCGLFHLTWAYWADGGKPTNGGQAPDEPDAYRNCATEPYCAARAVQGYMERYGQDCNGDGEINCYDHMAIHKLGGYGCSGDPPFQYVNAFNQCIAEAVTARG